MIAVKPTSLDSCRRVPLWSRGRVRPAVSDTHKPSSRTSNREGLIWVPTPQPGRHHSRLAKLTQTDYLIDLDRVSSRDHRREEGPTALAWRSTRLVLGPPDWPPRGWASRRRSRRRPFEAT